MKIAPIICWQLDSTLRPTMKRGFDIIGHWLLVTKKPGFFEKPGF